MDIAVLVLDGVFDLGLSSILGLQTSDATVDAIAEEVGYADAATLRNLLRRKTGRGIRALRGKA